jgi:hypothetical protein
VSETGVICYDQAGVVLAECADIDDVSDIRNALPARLFRRTRLSLSLQFSII